MKLKPGETLFRDESVFEPSYLPEDFLFRESQMKELRSCVLPAIKSGKPQNAFIFGRPATGKTTATKIFFAALSEETNRIVTVHVNSHIYNTHYRILGEIHKKIFGFVPPETGLPVSALYDKVFSRLEKENKSLIVALDDINFYEAKQANEILYDFLRAYEVFPKVKTAVWCITVRNELHRLDDKVRSTFVANTIEFLPYRKEEMKQILKARAIAGLSEGVVSDIMLEKIAGLSPDLRHGIELLKKSAVLAENDAQTKIAERHVAEAAKSFEAPASSSLMEDDIVLMDMLKRKSRESGELFEEFRGATGSSYATFYRALQKLKKKSLIDISPIEKEKGRSSRISLKKKG